MKLSEAIQILKNAGVESPAHDAKEIFSRLGDISKSLLISKDTSTDSKAVISAIERRKNREPLQYIIGDVGFYRETYKVSPDCLIPRQDTEILVDYAVKNIPSGAHFLDLCTGSGCVAISTLKNTQATTATATDISKGALKIAKENAELNGVSERLRLLLANALDTPLEINPFAILSNPPYVTASAYRELEKEIYFEPEIAFVGGEDGLVFYRKIIEHYIDKIDKNGFFAFEIGFDQGNALSSLSESFGLKCEILKDLSGLDRVAVLRL